MRRLILGFAGRTYHIVGNLMHGLIYIIVTCDKTHSLTSIGKETVSRSEHAWGFGLLELACLFVLILYVPSIIFQL